MEQRFRFTRPDRQISPSCISPRFRGEIVLSFLLEIDNRRVPITFDARRDIVQVSIHR